MPSVEILVKQDDPDNTETPNINSETTPAVSGDVAVVEPEMNEEMAAAEEEDTEHGWATRSNQGSEASEGEFFTSNHLMEEILKMGAQIGEVTNVVQDVQTQSARQRSVIFEL